MASTYENYDKLLSTRNTSDTSNEKLAHIQLSRNDLILLLEKLCRKRSNFTGKLKLQIASPLKIQYLIHILNGHIVSIECNEGFYVYRGKRALKKLIDLLSMPSIVGTAELVSTKESEVQLHVEVNPEARLEKPINYEDISMFLPLHNISVIEQGRLELGGKPLNINVPTAIEANVSETHKLDAVKIDEISRRMSNTADLLVEKAELVMSFDTHTPEKIIETLRIMSQSDHPNEPLIARVIAGEDFEEATCQVLFLNGVLLGMWCSSLGLESYGEDALSTLSTVISSLRVEVYKIPLEEIANTLKLNIVIGNNRL